MKKILHGFSTFENVVPFELRQQERAVGVQAKISDPYWFLARQWQTGEFRGSNGGSPLKIEVSYRYANLVLEQTSDSKISLDNGIPLQASVESKDNQLNATAVPNFNDSSDTISPAIDSHWLQPPAAWDQEHLEYRIEIKSNEPENPSPSIQIIADEYNGKQLDWYNFLIKNIGLKGWQDVETKQAVPTPVTYQGMPKTRFWEFEDSTVNFCDDLRSNNFLSLLLMELGFLNPNDWFIIPVSQKVNTLRQIDCLTIHDVFGKSIDVSEHKCSDPSQYQQFALNLYTNGDDNVLNATASTSKYFLYPNSIITAQTGEPIEKVAFFRDEAANLVWGVEQKINGIPDMQNVEPEPVAETNTGTSLLFKYHPLRLPPRNYIPYLPMQLSSKDGQVKLRRGRTIIDPFAKQFSTSIVEDTVRIFEEEIPNQPLAITQNAQLVCISASNDAVFNYYLWIGRKKGAAAKMQDSKLRFDSLE